MPLDLPKEIRKIIIDMVHLKRKQGGQLTEHDLRERSLRSLSPSLALNLHNQAYAHETGDGILSVSLAYQNESESLAVAVGKLDPLKSDQAVHSNTPYNIASISKFVLMVLCYRLSQEGHILMDKPISHYISEVGLPHLNEITLTHLLAHRSGLRDRAFVSFEEKESVSSFIKRKEDDFDLAGRPGEQFYYANINYILVTKVILAVMKKDLSGCLEDLIVRPLSLKGLTVIAESKLDDNPPARGYRADKEAKTLQDCSDHFIFGATGFRATPSTLTNLIRGFFKDSFIKDVNRKMILDSIRDEIFEVLTPENTYRWPTKMGIGIEEVPVTLDDGEIIKLYGHWGWQNGHASFMVFDPQDGSAYACCFSKTFGLEKIYQAHLRQAWVKYQRPLVKQLETKEDFNLPLMGLGCVDLRSENGDIIDLSLKRGVRLFDTAECYGGGLSESALGEKLKSQPRESLFISSKCGVRFDNSGIHLSGTSEYIKAACEASLKRLKMSYLDLYYLHRVDPKIQIEESVTALAELVKEGKIRYIGLSEVTESQLLRAHKVHPVAAVQIEYAPWSRQDEANGLIKTCQSLGVAVVAYSPLGRAFFTNVDENYFKDLSSGDIRKYLPRYNGDALKNNMKARQNLNQAAKEKGCSLAQLVLAWMMSKGLCVIPGTTKAEHLNENLGALLVKVSKIEQAKISRLIQDLKFSGERYPSSAVSGIFPEEGQPVTKSNLSKWLPSRKQAILGGFLAVGGFFAYSYLRTGSSGTFASVAKLTQPRGPYQK